MADSASHTTMQTLEYILSAAAMRAYSASRETASLYSSTSSFAGSSTTSLPVRQASASAALRADMASAVIYSMLPRQSAAVRYL